MEIDSADDRVSQVVERFIILEVNVKAIFDSDFHLHGDNLGRPFHFLVGQQNCEVGLFDDIELSCHDDLDIISHTACDSIKGFVLFLEIREFELVFFVFAEDAGGLQFLGKRSELSAEIFVGVDF